MHNFCCINVSFQIISQHSLIIPFPSRHFPQILINLLNLPLIFSSIYIPHSVIRNWVFSHIIFLAIQSHTLKALHSLVLHCEPEWPFNFLLRVTWANIFFIISLPARNWKRQKELSWWMVLWSSWIRNGEFIIWFLDALQKWMRV